MSVLSTHHLKSREVITREARNEELKQVTKSLERQDQSLTQAQIDPLRQGQRLDAIDQKPKHGKVFPHSHKCNSPKMMHSQSPVHNKFFNNQTSLLLFDHFSQNSPPCWHMHTSSLKRPKAPPEAETPPEQMLWNECNAGGVSESIQGYKDMSNI